MRTHKLKVRALALLMAGVLAAGSTRLPAAFAYAAEGDSQYYIKFLDTAATPNVEAVNQTIVEGTDINVITKMPSGYSISTTTPFAVRKTGVDGDASSNFKIVGEKNYYTLTARAGSSSVKEAQDYTLEAIYTAFVSSAIGYGSFNGKDADGKDVANRYVLDVSTVTSAGIAITEDSSITFSAESDESEEGIIGFAPVSATTGSFVQYKGGNVVASQFKTDSGGKYTMINVNSTDPSNPNPLALKAYFQGSAKILKGTTFTIEFRRQTINSLIAAVISEKKAVEETADDVQKNATNPSATDINVPYVKLANGDKLDAIRSNFEVLKSVHRFNVVLKLDWKWTADDAKYQDRVSVKAGASGKMVFEIKDRPYEDIKGNITVTVNYGSTTASRQIPIVIYGTGDPAKMQVTKQVTGVPGAADNIEPVTDVPKTMDVYAATADIKYYDKAPVGPYRFLAELSYGSGNGRASKAIIKSVSQGGEVEILVDGSSTPYKQGDPLENMGLTRMLDITAVKEGQLNFIVEFYNDNGELVKRSTIEKQINIRNSSPLTDARLKNITLFLKNDVKEDQDALNGVYPSGEYEFGFDRDVNEYILNVPYKAEKINLSPQIPAGTNAKEEIVVEYGTNIQKVQSGGKSSDIPLSVAVPVKTMVTSMAENGSTNTYIINITRNEKDKDSALKTLKAMRTDIQSPPDLIKEFNPEVTDYTIEVPYRAKEIELEVQSRSPWVSKIEYDPAAKTTGFWFWKKEILKFDLVCDFDPVTGDVINNVNFIKITVTAEDGIGQTTYTVKVTRLAPSVDNTLSSLVVKNKTNIEYKFDEGQVFSPDVRDYYLHIPYSETVVNIDVKANHEEAQKLSLVAPKVYGEGIVDAIPKRDAPTTFRNIDVSQNVSKPDVGKNTFDYKVLVEAESGAVTDPAYFIHFIRNDPDADTRLASLDIVDGANNALPTFAFNQEQLEYSINVPYEVTRITATPKAVSPLAIVEANGAKLSVNRPSVAMELLAGKTKTLTIVVTAESAESRTYTINLTRGLPSDEARLSDLKVDAITLKPKFNPNTLEYEIIIPEKVKGYTVTPTAVNQYATITVDTKPVKSGAASQKINPVEVLTKTVIEVTAQDGKTRLKYVINVRDENLIEKSSDADLVSVKVYDGALSPRFKKGIVDYEISLKNDTASVDLTPKPADENAKLEVMQGTKMLENYAGVYSTAILEDETEFKVKVTSSDESKTKEYKFIAYRNNEEKAGIYTPITADMVDFESEENPIKVDISKYAVVKAEVFNTLKTEYPDKSIVFQGTDYSLLINGKDISTLVPNTEDFDLSLSLSGPNNQAVIDLIHALDARNAPLQPVVLHFAHHGALPAPMQLSVSLGGFYKNLRMYWNYYNEESNRIDYYGYVSSNAQGTFSTPITHMSDYAVTTGMVYGSENKVGTQGVNGENLSSGATGGKGNPQTSVE